MNYKLDNFVSSLWFPFFCLLYVVVDVHIDSDFYNIRGEPFDWTLKFLSLPIVLVSVGFYFFFLKGYRAVNGDLKGVLFAIAVAAILIFFSSGYVLAANALLGDQITTTIQGKVITKEMKSGRRSPTRYYLSVLDFSAKKLIFLNVPKDEYEKYDKNSNYSEKWFIGFFGLTYK